MENQSNVVVLEPSTNTHTMHGEGAIKTENLNNGILKIKTTGRAYLRHGEHGTLATEAEHIIKYVQQEVNPVTRAIQNAYD